MANRPGFSRKDLLIVVLVLAALSALIVPALLAAREEASASSCLGRMYKLKNAVEKYRDTNGKFPPAVLVDEVSNAEHSWRVLIRPYLWGNLDNYRWDQSWDSEHNSLVFPKSDAEHFQCPSGRDLNRTECTNYVCVRGSETVFPNDWSIKLEDITDGAENTIVLVEAHGLGIHWREPRDLDFATMSFEINGDDDRSIRCPHPKGPVVTFADNAYRRLSDTITGADVKSMLTIDAGDSPQRTEIDRDGVILSR